MNEQQPLSKKVIIFFILFVSIVAIDKLLIETFIVNFISKNAVLIIRGLLYAAGIVDLVYSFKDFLKYIINKIAHSLWEQIKKNIEDYLRDYSNTAFDNDRIEFNAVSIIQKILFLYPHRTEQDCNKLCEFFKKNYSNTEYQGFISYFFISNYQFPFVKTFIEQNDDFYAECKKYSEKTYKDYLKYSFPHKKDIAIQKDYKKLVVGLLHFSLMPNPCSTLEGKSALRKTYTWIDKNKEKIFSTFSQDYLIIILQSISKLNITIEKNYKEKKDKELKKHYKKIRALKKCRTVKRYINKTFRNLCFTNNKKIKCDKIDLYSKQAGLITAYFDELSILKKIQLCMILNYKNHIFDKHFYGISIEYVATLLFSAEILNSSDIDPHEFQGKISNLLYSVATLVIG